MHATALRIVRRGLATAAAHPPHAGAASSTTTVSAASAIPLSNVEAQWATLSTSEQAAVHQQLEALQQKDWKVLSLAEKKAGACLFTYHMRKGRSLVLPVVGSVAYYVAFGPHGPRAPVNPQGTTVKVVAGVGVLIASAGLIYGGIRSVGALMFALLCGRCGGSFCVVAPPPPRTITKEWEEASNERAKEHKMNPITGSWYSPIFAVLSNFAHAGFLGISSEGYSGKGFVTHK
jgi:cytochrome c oxidase subunit 4